MTDYQPTDEQIEAFAREDYIQWGNPADFWSSSEMPTWIAEARSMTGYPAFQSIIRAAQAEAFIKFADNLGVNAGDEDSDYWDGYRNGQRQAYRIAQEHLKRIRGEATDV